MSYPAASLATHLATFDDLRLPCMSGMYLLLNLLLDLQPMRQQNRVRSTARSAWSAWEIALCSKVMNDVALERRKEEGGRRMSRRRVPRSFVS